MFRCHHGVFFFILRVKETREKRGKKKKRGESRDDHKTRLPRLFRDSSPNGNERRKREREMMMKRVRQVVREKNLALFDRRSSGGGFERFFQIIGDFSFKSQRRTAVFTFLVLMFFIAIRNHKKLVT